MKKPKIKMPSDREALILQLLVGGREKYGLELRELYQERSGENLPLGSLYTTLSRMEEHGYINSRMGEETHERGGNRRKYFKITGAGASAMELYLERIASRKSILTRLREAFIAGEVGNG